MAYNNNERGRSPIKNNISFLLFFAIVSLLFAALGAQAQTPSPSPSSPITSDPLTWFGGYNVTSSIEMGVRGVSVGGNDNKFRSDFNYRPGVRLFDSSFFLENKDQKSRAIDSLLITSSGWNADPSGYTRISVERDGFYRFDSTIRQVVYFNNLNNYARGIHYADTRRNFGDFDLTLYPKSDKLKIRLGAGFNKTNGSGATSARAYSDEYAAPSKVDSGTIDFRGGVDTILLGFNTSFTYGYRRFKDNTTYLSGPNVGFNTASSSGEITSFSRSYPIKGATHFGLFNVHRTFARKLDFTGRIAYSLTDRDFGFLEIITGRNSCSGTNCNRNIVDLDRFDISGSSRRQQTRADLGLTYAVTDNFRISDTFTFDQFNINGGENYYNALYQRTSSGGAVTTQQRNDIIFRITHFRRFTNTIEGDYQFSDRFGIHLGYRYSKRQITVDGSSYSVRFDQAPSTTNPNVSLSDPDEEENQTHTIIAGFKAKPLKNWTIFGDLERGDADNAFTRLANYKFTNFRVRSRWSFKQLVLNVSALSKDNENPSTSTAPQGNVTGDFIANIKNRLFSASIDWTPTARYTFSGGYTFNRITSDTDIVINTGTLVRGRSEFYMRDHYAFFNLTAQPFRRVTFYAGYNYNQDLGQGDRIGVLPIVISSYPFKLRNAESRLAFRFTKNIEWNLGYQYISYSEAVQPLSTTGTPQNYHAHLPYTSVRIYFGGGDR
jgi:hypothetical protein